MSELPHLPPPSRRQLPAGEPRDDVEDGLRLLALHGSLLECLTQRSPADFRPLAMEVQEAGRRLRELLDAPEMLPPSLVAGLAPLLTPRLVRLRHHLRRRLARTREDVPLRRVREMDPACLRVNARRPGLTLLEKAGPRQVLRAVVRVERFDTSENRVLRAACLRLQRSAQAALQGLSRERERTVPMALRLRALHRVASALVESEELKEVGLPRAGERPSNALLGDSDYRAVWRALQMLREEDERFAEEWRAMERVLDELILVVAWSRFDGHEGLEPVPGWVRTRHRRTGSGRIDTDGPRRWVRFGREQMEEWEVWPHPGALELVHRRWTGAGREARTTRLEGLLVHTGGDSSGRRLRAMLASESRLEELPADGRVLSSLGELLEIPDPVEPVPAAAPRRQARGLVALSALNATLCVTDDSGSFEAGPSAVADMSVEGESLLRLMGRAATLVSGGVAGPLALHGSHAESYSSLLQAWRSREVEDLAVVVPDRTHEEVLQRLRTHVGACWAVWQPVAVALYLGEREPHLVTPAPGQTLRVLIIALSEAANDVALLTCKGEPGGERIWRREPPGMGLPSGEASRMEPVEAGIREALHAAWLRHPDETEAWVRMGDDWRRAPVPQAGEHLAEAIRKAAVSLAGADVDLVAVTGAEPRLLERLRECLAPRQLILLPSEASVRGARIFLERYRDRRPTWEDRLPSLDVEVREHGGGMRRYVDVVPKETYARPGQSLSFVSSQQLVLEAGREVVHLRLLRDGRSAPFRLELSGPPLPLSQPTRVGISIRFRYGVEDIDGRLEPVESASFERIPFRLQGQVPEAEEQESSGRPPEYRPPPAPEPEALERISKFLQELMAWWRGVPQAQRMKAKSTPGLLDGELIQRLETLDEALHAIRGTGPESLPADARRRLEEEVASQLDWFLGLRKTQDKRDLAPPALTEKVRNLLVRARARTGVRGAPGFGQFLLKEMAKVKAGSRGPWWWALGRIVDGQPDELWDVLVETEPANDEERRSMGDAILWALQAQPNTALALAERRVFVTLGALRRALEGIKERSARRRDHFAFLLQSLCHLCRSRGSGLLPPNAEQVVDTVTFLRQLREQLPDEVLRQAVRSSEQDEPLSMAVDALEGRSVTLPLAGRGT
jgi:hypothetical protein